MRSRLTAQKLREFMEALAAEAQSSGNVYFTGGATALLLGIREQTIDVDLKLDPEPSGVFKAIAALKNKLDLNVELAAPSDFIPVAPDWQTRSVYIDRFGLVSFYHFDLLAQALSKIERGYANDLDDAKAFLRAADRTPGDLWHYYQSVQPNLERYPAINPADLERKVRFFIESYGAS
jgi:hypothetical protein